MGRKRDNDDDEPEGRQTWREKVAPSRRAQDLARKLVSMGAAEWPHLGMDDVVVEALEEHAGIPSGRHIARQRALRRLQTLLITEDLDAVEEAMGTAGKGQTERQEQVQALERERQRIVEGGKEAEAAFVDAHPGTERQRLRQLAANARRAKGDAAVKRANRKLMDLLMESAGLA